MTIEGKPIWVVSYPRICLEKIAIFLILNVTVQRRTLSNSLQKLQFSLDKFMHPPALYNRPSIFDRILCSHSSDSLPAYRTLLIIEFLHRPPIYHADLFNHIWLLISNSKSHRDRSYSWKNELRPRLSFGFIIHLFGN